MKILKYRNSVLRLDLLKTFEITTLLNSGVLSVSIHSDDCNSFIIDEFEEEYLVIDKISKIRFDLENYYTESLVKFLLGGSEEWDLCRKTDKTHNNYINKIIKECQ